MISTDSRKENSRSVGFSDVVNMLQNCDLQYCCTLFDNFPIIFPSSIKSVIVFESVSSESENSVKNPTDNVWATRAYGW